MFSANENLALRQHKRRIIQYIEETIEEDVLDQGATVMVMQVSCKAPGCVPLETVVCIVFPKFGGSKELIPDLPESSSGGTFKTKVLMPMSDVTKDDVLDALPPAFKGGRQSMEKLFVQARDIMLAQITQLVESKDSKQLMTQYLQQSLQDYLDRDCEPPEYGEPFPEINEATSVHANEATHDGKGNLVIRRVRDETHVQKPTASTKILKRSTTGATVPTTNDWRRQQKVDAQLNANSQTLLAQLMEKEHAPGIRRAGCPCCDPDNISNIVDNMSML